MGKVNLAVTWFLSMLLLFGCNNDANVEKTEEVNRVGFELIASEKSLPSYNHGFMFQREEVPKHTYWVKEVQNQPEYESVWKVYGLEGKKKNVDFNKESVFFIGVQESSSCPYAEENVKISADNGVLKVLLTEEDGICTSDATPRTFVIQGDKDLSKRVKDIMITQSGTETNVPINE